MSVQRCHYSRIETAIWINTNHVMWDSENNVLVVGDAGYITGYFPFRRGGLGTLSIVPASETRRPFHWWFSTRGFRAHNSNPVKVIFIPPASTKLIGGYTGITLSVCPSVRLWTESCPLCIFNNTQRIHFIFAHLIKQLKKVCRV